MLFSRQLFKLFLGRLISEILCGFLEVIKYQSHGLKGGGALGTIDYQSYGLDVDPSYGPLETPDPVQP